MISSKYISKITVSLVSVILVLCVLAIGFSDKFSATSVSAGYTMEYEEKLFDTSEIIDINIIMDGEKWDEMLENASQETYYECDAVINGTTFKSVAIRPKGNTSLSSIARDPDNNRYSFKLEFDGFIDGQTCFGLDKLILNNNYADATNMKEAIIYDMFNYLGADASLYNYAKISVNDEYWGVYLALEAVEGSFMLRNYGTEKGYLYKPDSMNHNNSDKDKSGGKSSGNGFQAPPGGDFGGGKEGFAKMPDMKNGESPSGRNGKGRPDKASEDGESPSGKSGKGRPDNNSEGGENQSGKRGMRGGMPGGGGFGNMGGGANLNYIDDELDSYSTIWDGEINKSDKKDHKRVITALKNISQRNDIEKYIDVDQILKYMAVHNFSVNEDSLSGNMAHNYYLYEANGQISIVPWDYNLSFGGMGRGSGTSVVNSAIDDSWSSTQLFDFVFESEEYTARYHEYYEKLINEYFESGRFDETYNRIRSQIDGLVKDDPNAMYDYDEYVKAAEILYETVTLRAQSIKGQLDGSIPSTSEAQTADSSSLIDASFINLSDMGQFMNGGFDSSEDDD